MGIAQAAAKMLMREGIRRSLSGRVLTLGRQHIYLTVEKLHKIAKEMNFCLSEVTNASSVSANERERNINMSISDVTLFHSLGFSELKSLDFSDYEGADIIFDLNSYDLPPELEGAFDVIIDSGTIEHVFHLPNVLKNLSKMIGDGGRIIYLAPSSNHIDHGFYMFSPTLFYDYYQANSYEINTIELFKYSQKHDTEPWFIYDYKPGCLNSVSFGGLDDAMYGIHCVVTKGKASSYDIIPQQGGYVKTWSRCKRPSNQNGIRGSIISIIKDNQYAYKALLPVVKAIRSMKRRLKVTRKGVGLAVKAKY